MADIYELIGKICNSLKPVLSECGFTPVYPEGASKDELPIQTKNGKITVDYKGENRAVRLEHFNGKLFLYGVLKEGEILQGDYAQITVTLLEPETADEKDVKYAVNEFSESLVLRFGAKAKVKKKLPSTVSKSAVENGAVSYDANTLVSRFTGLYPELRAAYKENFEKYDVLLSEEFFVEHGNAVVIEAIRRNNPTEMKKLFNLFNEMYLDGTNDTQSLVAVTILGSLKVIDPEEQLLANCLDYACTELTSALISVNKYLASSKSARMRLENPPKYKPKKKSKGLGSRIGQ